jgi:thiamine kinase-like enzyme
VVTQEWAQWRFDRFTDTPELFAGNALLHSDVAPGNFLMHNGAATVVDWAYPTRGAAFLDCAQLVVQLIAADHTPEDAERWAEGCKAWQAADPVAVDAFVAAEYRLQQWAAEKYPGDDWHNAMVRAATEWAEYRRALGGI